MRAIAFDTSSARVSIVLFEDWEIAETFESGDSVKQQSKILISQIKEMLKNCEWTSESVDEIYVGQGPGSFTGLRMGLTAAKVWAYSMKKPLFVFNSRHLFERTKEHMPEATGPSVILLEKEDLIRVENLDTLAPLYENDHFKEDIK